MSVVAEKSPMRSLTREKANGRRKLALTPDFVSVRISRRRQMLGTLLNAGGFSAFVGYAVLFNLRGRKAERALAQARGIQDATSFAEMFPTEAERVVARTLYPQLERLT